MIKSVALETLGSGAAPTTPEGRETVTALENAQVALTQLNRDITRADEEVEQAQERVDNAEQDVNRKSEMVVRQETFKQALEAALVEDEEALEVEENRDPPADDKAARIEALRSSIADKKLRIIVAGADVAAAKTAETQARARLGTANAQSTELAGRLTALEAKRGPARGEVATARIAAGGVELELPLGSAAAVSKIATASAGFNSLVAACLAWAAKEDRDARSILTGHCNDIIALSLKLAEMKAASNSSQDMNGGVESP